MSKNIKLKVYDYYSPDVDIFSWEPETAASVRFLLELEIGVEGDVGTNLFQVMITTPEGLRDRANRAAVEVLADRATIVISEYSWETVKRAVDLIVERCRASTWDESALKLQRYFHWEYEDYTMEA